MTLGRGVFTAFWLVTSQDTHVAHGAFSFGVGVKVRTARGIPAYPYDPSGPIATGLRWLSLIAAALIAGTTAFGVFVLAPAAFPAGVQPALAHLAARGAALRRAGIGIAVVAGILALDVQTAAATGVDALAAVPAMAALAVQSTWGFAWIARMLAIAGIGALTWTGRTSSVSLALCGVLLLSFSQSGHASARGALLAFDVVHFAAAAVWFGGLATLATGMSGARGAIEASARPSFVRALIGRFSVVAVLAVIALAASGIAASLAHFVTLKSLTKTPYARVIVAKLVLFVPLLALGWYHLRFGRRANARVFTATLACETAIVAAVLALSAALSGLPPPLPPGSEHG